jgi:hypothetical protein
MEALVPMGKSWRIACFEPHDRPSCDGIAIGKALLPPTFHDLIAGCRKRAAIDLLVTSLHDTPIDRATQRTVVRVITLADGFAPPAVELTDIRR